MDRLGEITQSQQDIRLIRNQAGVCFSKQLFGPERASCQTSICFFSGRKTMKVAKIDGLEHWRCAGIMAIVAPETDPKSFGTCEKQAPGPPGKISC